VLKADDEYNQLAENQLGDDSGPFNATPAVSDGAIFLRSDQALYCVASP
jgi:hypothetical protein